MRKYSFTTVLAGALTIASVVSAAPVDIIARQTSSTTWDVLVQTSVDIGGIALEVMGFDSRTLNLEGVPEISPLDSPLVIDSNGTGHVLVNNLSSDVALLPAGSPETLLMTLVGSGGPTTIVSGDASFGYTALNERLDTILDYSLALVFADGTTHPPAPIPEPQSILLFAVGSAILAWAIATNRRDARGGDRATNSRLDRPKTS